MSLKHKLKRYYRILCKKEILLTKQIKHDVEILGSEYGSFGISKNALNDKKSLICYSFGIGEDISFDLGLINRFNCNVFAFDPTPKSIEWIKNQNLPRNFNEFAIGVSWRDGIERFFMPKNKNHVSGSIAANLNVNAEDFIEVEVKKITTIMNSLNHSYVDIIKMDIEGLEFQVIENLIEENVEFGQLCVEVHQRFFDDGLERLKKLVKLLNDKEYYLFYVSDNGEELGFAKK